MVIFFILEGPPDPKPDQDPLRLCPITEVNSQMGIFHRFGRSFLYMFMGQFVMHFAPMIFIVKMFKVEK